MIWSAIVLAAILISFAAIHFACACTALRWRPISHQGQAYRPKTAIILPVRGLDPTLRDTIVGLLQQDYDTYEVFIVVDHSTDPAWNAVREILDGNDPLQRCHLEVLAAPGTQCGLKCAAIAQVVETLDDVEVIATLDADVSPSRSWLAELVAPLTDPAIGAVTGNHWFEPTRLNVGSLVRSLWNAGSLIPATFFGNPWGGTCAMRVADVLEGGLVADWQKSAVDDGPIRNALNRLGKKIVFSPAHLMINEESCSLRFCRQYMARILTWSRTYEASFRWTVAHGVVNVTPWIASLILAAVAGFRGHGSALGIILIGLAGHAFFLWASYAVIRRAVRRCVAPRGKTLSPWSIGRVLGTLALTPLAFVTYAWSLLRALSQRYVQWRGNWYYVAGPQQVVLLSYRPFHSVRPDGGASQQQSI